MSSGSLASVSADDALSAHTVIVEPRTLSTKSAPWQGTSNLSSSFNVPLSSNLVSANGNRLSATVLSADRYESNVSSERVSDAFGSENLSTTEILSAQDSEPLYSVRSDPVLASTALSSSSQYGVFVDETGENYIPVNAVFDSEGVPTFEIATSEEVNVLNDDNLNTFHVQNVSIAPHVNNVVF